MKILAYNDIPEPSWWREPPESPWERYDDPESEWGGADVPVDMRFMIDEDGDIIWDDKMMNEDLDNMINLDPLEVECADENVDKWDAYSDVMDMIEIFVKKDNLDPGTYRITGDLDLWYNVEVPVDHYTERDEYEEHPDEKAYDEAELTLNTDKTKFIGEYNIEKLS